MKKTVFLIFGLIAAANLLAINPKDSVKYVNWFNLDEKDNKVLGISTDKAYRELLEGKESKKVIVAVIDGGVDVKHEDLVGKIWVNKDEIPGNGIDDDNNGYVDDINGWNFLGGDEGKNIKYETLELTRLYRKYSDKFNGLSEDEIKNKYPEDYQLYSEVVSEYNKEITQYESASINMMIVDSILRNGLNKESLADITVDDLKNWNPEKKTPEYAIRKSLLKFIKMGYSLEQFSEEKEYYDEKLSYHLNVDFDPRSDIVGDNPDVVEQRNYGNNDVIGSTPFHGTFVSGIIAANRDNNIGIKGIAGNVEIMAVRAVPDGDERDKDVANAIRYAIENGAQIINMSFGKAYSPNKQAVDEAIKLAEEHNVLLIHASGNDHQNVDVEPSYPSVLDKNNEVLTNNWIEVGASFMNKKKDLAASFSNYGSKTVDIFAPGVNIISTKEFNNYDMGDGTSFASPMVAGAAALLKSYYPSLTAKQLKEILLQSAVNLGDLQVMQPGSGKKDKNLVPFSQLSATGGVLNVYYAINLAEKISN